MIPVFKNFWHFLWSTKQFCIHVLSHFKRSILFVRFKILLSQIYLFLIFSYNFLRLRFTLSNISHWLQSVIQNDILTLDSFCCLELFEIIGAHPALRLLLPSMTLYTHYIYSFWILYTLVPLLNHVLINYIFNKFVRDLDVLIFFQLS